MSVEISQFRLVEDADTSAFVAAAEETQTGFLERQEGFVSRDLLRSEDGMWMDIVRFDSMAAAQAAFQAFTGHPSATTFESMLDVSSMSMTHWSAERSWPSPEPRT